MRTLPGLGLVARFHLDRRLPLYVAVSLVLVLMLAPAVRAQDGSTSLQGVIEDVSGARIASAAITVTDSSRGFRLQAVTDAQGTFNFGMLPPGRYDVIASAPGMATKTSRGVELLVGGVSVVHLRLSPAALTQTITVSATPDCDRHPKRRDFQRRDAVGHRRVCR